MWRIWEHNDAELVTPNTSLSVYECNLPGGESMSWFRDELVNNAYKFDFHNSKTFYQLTNEQKSWYAGNQYFQGLNDFLKN
jgi:excinuclease ABC subunit A